MQTLTSSEKVDLGTDLGDVVFFFPPDSPASSFLTAEGMEGEVCPFQTERLQSWGPKDARWPQREPGKDEASHRLKSHRSLI